MHCLVTFQLKVRIWFFGFMRVEMGKEDGQGMTYVVIGGDLPPRFFIVKICMLFINFLHVFCRGSIYFGFCRIELCYSWFSID